MKEKRKIIIRCCCYFVAGCGLWQLQYAKDIADLVSVLSNLTRVFLRSRYHHTIVHRRFPIARLIILTLWVYY